MRSRTLLGGLDGGRALAFASGMAAAAVVFQRLAVGSTIAVPTDPYHGVAGIVAEGERQGRWTVRRLDQADTAAWVDAVAECDLVWLESPENPLITVADLPDDLLGAASRHHDRRRRQHVRDAAQPAAARARRRRRDALGDQVHRRPLRPARRRARGRPRRPVRRVPRASPAPRRERSGRWRRSSTIRGARTLGLRLERCAGERDGTGAASRGASRDRPRALSRAWRATRPTRSPPGSCPGFGAMLSFETTGAGERATAGVRTSRADQPRHQPRRGRVDDGAAGDASPARNGSRRR